MHRKNFIIGIEDCICRLSNDTGRSLVSDILQAVEIPGASEWVNNLVEEGHFVCFFTPWHENLRGSTEKWLKMHGFKFNSLVMEKPVAPLYHYVDDRHVQATTFKGKYTTLIRKEHTIEVFE
ncbi:MAG: phosphoheptose isomerase [Nitrososphaerales archaeon]